MYVWTTSMIVKKNTIIYQKGNMKWIRCVYCAYEQVCKIISLKKIYIEEILKEEINISIKEKFKKILKKVVKNSIKENNKNNITKSDEKLYKVTKKEESKW